MCNVLVVTSKRFKNEEEKKEFQRNKSLEIKQQKTSPVIMFVSTHDKKAQKTIDKYISKHPKAIVWGN